MKNTTKQKRNKSTYFTLRFYFFLFARAFNTVQMDKTQKQIEKFANI